MGSILRPYPSNLRRTATEPPNHHPGTSCWGLAIKRPSRVHQPKPFRRARDNDHNAFPRYENVSPKEDDEAAYVVSQRTTSYHR